MSSISRIAREVLTQPDEEWAAVIWIGIAFAAGQALSAFEYGDLLGAVLRVASGALVLLVARQLRRWALDEPDATPAPNNPTPERELDDYDW